MDTPNSPMRFGVFELDARAGELRRSGSRVALQPQPLEILRALIERPGEVVTREELRRRLWSNGAYVDFDRSLNKAIVKLRDALGDDADSPRYIETLPRHGYRFIPLPQALAQVDAAPGAQGALTAGMPQPEGPTSPQLSPVSGVLPAGTRHGWRWAALGLTLLVLSAWLIGSWFRVEAPSHSGSPANVAPTGAVAFAPPPHSIAVLPLVNLSGDKEQEYFSDGLTEELLNSLARINELRIAGRTSSFYFKDKDVDLRTIAQRLNVAAVLDGSVRRSAHTVRVTARLTDAITGFNLWSATYDRDLGDILRLQSEIANAVAAALKVRLLGNTAVRVELGGTRNPAAFDAYLRASQVSSSDILTLKEEVVAGYTEAVELDPDYALARAARSIALAKLALFDMGPSMRNHLDTAQAEALKAANLAPELADSHLALAVAAEESLDFVRAEKEYERAVALEPESERMLRAYARFAALMGHFDQAVAAARRAVLLNPLDYNSHKELGQALELARRYDEAIPAWDDALALAPDNAFLHAHLGFVYYALGNFERSRSVCEIKLEHFVTQVCLASAYEKLGRHRDAQAELAKLRAAAGEAGAYLYAIIYAEWGRPAESLEWLDTATRLRSPWLVWLKVEYAFNPLRKEPRFRAIAHALNFPS